MMTTEEMGRLWASSEMPAPSSLPAAITSALSRTEFVSWKGTLCGRRFSTKLEKFPVNRVYESPMSEEI